MSKSKYDNNEKIIVIQSGIVGNILQKKKELYYGRFQVLLDNDTGIFEKVLFDTAWNDFVLSRYDDKQLDCALLLLDSKKRKIAKVRKKISDIVLNNNAVFITLTFRDAVLASTTPQTRRRYVARYLKSQGCEYVANIDFSPDIGREHYHAVICSRVNLSAWKYGFSSAEKVRAHKSDIERLNKYITKLTNHALKIDMTRLIYSRV